MKLGASTLSKLGISKKSERQNRKDGDARNYFSHVDPPSERMPFIPRLKKPGYEWHDL
jgi:hypothetical protein